MNTLPRLILKSLLKGLLTPPALTTVSRLKRSRVRSAKIAVITAFATLFGVNLLFSIGLDTFWRRWRDAEYIERRQRVEARQSLSGTRPLVVVLGSSRVGMGIHPLAADDDGAPVFANMGLVGSGPLLQLLTLQRLLRDGIAPDEVLIEYWPAFLNHNGWFSEYIRIDPHRFYPDDEPFIRGYMPDPDAVLRLMREIRRTPIWCNRLRLMSHLLPTWLPQAKRFDLFWVSLDAGGWLPGSGPVSDEVRAARTEMAAVYYRDSLSHFELNPKAEPAMREMIAICRAKGIRVKLLWMPESSTFRGFYPPAMLATSAAFLANFDIPIINARDWMPDTQIADGYHLTTDGAAAFTKRLAAELTSGMSSGRP